MTDTTQPEMPAPAIGSAEKNGQLISAITIIVAVTIICVGLIIAGAYQSDWRPSASTIIATAVGGLLSALNVPGGIAGALRSAMGGRTATTQNG